MATASPSGATSDNLEVFLGAVQDILVDEGFKLPTPQATSALQAASAVLEWSSCAENKTRLSQFCRELTRYLQQCLPVSTPTAANREDIWRNFHIFRTSKDYFILWDKFLKDSIKKGGPIFFQHITSLVFSSIVKKSFPVIDINANTSPDVVLTDDEKKALRYASGYIPRNLMKKLERSAEDSKERLVMCLMEVIEEDVGVYDESQDWLKLVNRGGLYNINSRMFNFMMSMELVVKMFLRKEDKPRDIRTELARLIEGSGEVKQKWQDVSAEWDTKDAETLFRMTTNLWVTMRGFAYASGWLEKWNKRLKNLCRNLNRLEKNSTKTDCHIPFTANNIIIILITDIT